MLIEINKTIKSLIDLPPVAYVKYGKSFFRITDSKECIQVDTYDFCRQIQVTVFSPTSVPFSLEGWGFCSQEMFDQAFSEVLSFIKEITSVETEAIKQQISEINY